MRGPNKDSDLFLQKVIIKQQLFTTYGKKILIIKKWNKANVQNPIKPRQYRTQLYNRVKYIADQQEINEEWENIKTAIIKSAKEIIQLEEKFPKNG